MSADHAGHTGPLGQAIVDLVVYLPPSNEQVQEHPRARAHHISRIAARRTSLVAGSLSLPPGFLGWLTVVPELISVWKIQAQMVADIAAIYGKQKSLGREQMLYCLFKHVSAQLFRDIVVRVGAKVVIQQTTQKMIQSIAQQLGIKLTHKIISKSAARFVPFLGAVGVGAYAYFDTLQVAKNAVELFEGDITIDAAP